MTATVRKVELSEIQPLRVLFLQETNFQIRYDACHVRGWTDSYLVTMDDCAIGYGSIRGHRQHKDRDTVFEYFIVQPFRSRASQLFRQLLDAASVKYIECQSNDVLLSSMLYEFSRAVSSDVVLFEDHAVTRHVLPGAVFRKSRGDDKMFEHKAEPVGEYVVEMGGEVVATGGFLLHYNKPFADLYMEVREEFRGRGIASYLLQEVKRECYLAGRVPAARCSMTNPASRASLIKAGMRVCGFMLIGKVDRKRLGN